MLKSVGVLECFLESFSISFRVYNRFWINQKVPQGLILPVVVFDYIRLEPTLVTPLGFVHWRPAAIIDCLPSFRMKLGRIEGHANRRSVFAIVADANLSNLPIGFFDFAAPVEVSTSFLVWLRCITVSVLNRKSFLGKALALRTETP